MIASVWLVSSTSLPRDRQQALGILEVAVLQATAGDGRRQTRVGRDDLRRQLRHRTAHRRRAAVQEQLQPMLGDQAAGLLPILARERVADREHRLPLLRIPARRAAVQRGDLRGWAWCRWARSSSANSG